MIIDEDFILKMRFNLKTRIILYKRLMSYTQEDFPVYDSLLKFRNRYEKNKDFKYKLIDKWLFKMKNGQPFSKAIEGWVPEAELNLIVSGENGPGIDEGLKEAIKFAESSKKIKSTIIEKGMYPVVLIFALMGFIAMFSMKIAPTYISILPVDRWPSMGQDLYFISRFIVNYFVFCMFVGAGLFYLIGKTLGSWTHPVRVFFDFLPPWSIYKTYHSCSFLISLASLMKSGTPLNESLKRIRVISSPWLQEYISRMLINLKKGGKNFGQHLDVGLLDKETAGDVIDYSELGKFEEAIYTIGENNLEESIVKIGNNMAILKNIVIVLLGVAVGTIYYTTVDLNSIVAENVSSQSKMVKLK